MDKYVTSIIILLLVFSCSKESNSLKLNFELDEINHLRIVNLQRKNEDVIISDKKDIKEIVYLLTNKSKRQVIKFYGDYQIFIKTNHGEYLYIVKFKNVKYNGKTYIVNESINPLIIRLMKKYLNIKKESDPKPGKNP